MNGPVQRLRDWAGDSAGWIAGIAVLVAALVALGILVWLTHLAIEALH